MPYIVSKYKSNLFSAPNKDARQSFTFYPFPSLLQKQIEFRDNVWVFYFPFKRIGDYFF